MEFIAHVREKFGRHITCWFIVATTLTIVGLVSAVMNMMRYDEDRALMKIDRLCEPNKSYKTALVLSFYFGLLGADRFYLGDIFLGILKLISCGGLGIWYIFDTMLLVYDRVLDHEGCPLIP